MKATLDEVTKPSNMLSSKFPSRSHYRQQYDLFFNGGSMTILGIQMLVYLVIYQLRKLSRMLLQKKNL